MPQPPSTNWPTPPLCVLLHLKKESTESDNIVFPFCLYTIQNRRIKFIYFTNGNGTVAFHLSWVISARFSVCRYVILMEVLDSNISSIQKTYFQIYFLCLQCLSVCANLLRMLFSDQFTFFLFYLLCVVNWLCCILSSVLSFSLCSVHRYKLYSYTTTTK